MPGRRGAGAWPAGATFNTYHLIDVPATQPAGPVRLEARAYDTRTLEPILAGASKELRSVALADASVTPPLAPVDPAAIRIGRPHSHTFASGIELLGTDPWPPTVNAGQTLPLKLYWRAGKTPSTPPASQRPPGRHERQTPLPTSAPMSSSRRPRPVRSSTPTPTCASRPICPPAATICC